MYHCKINPRLIKPVSFFIGRYQHANVLEIDKNLSKLNLEETDNDTQKDLTQSVPEFPPILDLSRTARNRRNREVWYNKVKQLGTVEEKIFELNMPRYYGWKSCKIEEGKIPYNPLPFAQYITRTHIVEEPGLPAYYNDLLTSEKLEELVQQIKNQVEEFLIFEYCGKKCDDVRKTFITNLEREKHIENRRTQNITEEINRILISNLGSHNNHLLETQLDINPRNESFWFFGGHETPYEVVRARKGSIHSHGYINEPINQCISYKGTPILQLRHHLPLNEIMSLEESEDITLTIPEETHDPRKVGYMLDRSTAKIIPGFWPGAFDEFGIVSYHNRSHLLERPDHFDDHLDAIKTQAVFGSYSWLYGQACYQGFSTFQDPTYPLVNQMVITNGQWWSFSTYQLNATVMHVDYINENKKRNMCWITEPMKLFESIQNGKIEGFNEDVLKCLIKFYVNVPKVKEGVEMKPYLSQEKVIAGIEDPERRIWLEDRYKHLQSNRSRHMRIPEIYHWQKIYMINNKTRPLEKKREPWQFKIDVFKRRLDEHTPQYIPKCLREHPRSRKKWAKTYYPTVPGDKTDS